MEGKHNLYIDMLKERQYTMENGRINAKFENFYESELETKYKNASNDERM